MRVGLTESLRIHSTGEELSAHGIDINEPFSAVFKDCRLAITGTMNFGNYWRKRRTGDRYTIQFSRGAIIDGYLLNYMEIPKARETQFYMTKNRMGINSLNMAMPFETMTQKLAREIGFDRPVPDKHKLH